MFSGIVEEYAEVVRIVKEQENLHLTLKCSFVDELKIDQSVSHNGVCLTVVSIQDGTYTVTAMKETIERSNIGLLKEGDKVNVERSMMMNGRLDGHIVQGHVDQTAECIDIKDAEGSWYFTFQYKFDKEMAKRGYMTVDKGSVTVNGVSLTVCNPTDNSFQGKPILAQNLCRKCYIDTLSGSYVQGVLLQDFLLHYFFGYCLGIGYNQKRLFELESIEYIGAHDTGRSIYLPILDVALITRWKESHTLFAFELQEVVI